MKILIVVDMQNDFLTGALANPEAVRIIPKIKEKIRGNILAGNPVIFTRDTHYDDYLETREGRFLPVVHCVENSSGWEICDDLREYATNIVDKRSFGYDEWLNYIYKNIDPSLEIEEIELVGTCTDICVISNAMILRNVFPESEIVVDADCCAGLNDLSHQNALEAMKLCHITVDGFEEASE